MKTLTSFEFAAAAGRRSKWNWTLLTNGQIHQLDHGTDYTAKYAAAQIKKYAESKQLKVRVAGGNPGNPNVVLQFANAAGEFVTPKAPEVTKMTRTQAKASKKNAKR